MNATGSDSLGRPTGDQDSTGKQDVRRVRQFYSKVEDSRPFETFLIVALGLVFFGVLIDAALRMSSCK